MGYDSLDPRSCQRKEVRSVSKLNPGDKAPVSGIYRPVNRPGTPVAISQGETLPPTPKPNTGWTLKTPASPSKK
jgi:hypothetical protein